MNYHDLMAPVALRINALDGTEQAPLEVTYSVRPLINASFQSSIFPFSAIRDAILNAEQKLVEAIAFSADRTLRAYISSVTAPLASGAVLPSLDVNNEQIIGNFGEVKEETTGIVMTRMPVPVLRNRLLTTAVYLVNPYYYALDGQTILHTGDNDAILQCCVYNLATQVEAFNFNEPILLPDTLAEAYIQGALAMLIRDDEFVQQATQYANYFGTVLANIPRAPMEQTAI